MKVKLRISKRAVRDIENVLAYTRLNFGEQKFKEYKILIRDALRALAVNPTNLPAKIRPELGSNVWTFQIARRGKPARHLFVYRVVGGQLVDISRLLHDSMDLQRHLPKEFGP